MRDHQRLRDDLLALEAEQQHQRRQQRGERERLQSAEEERECPPARRPPTASVG